MKLIIITLFVGAFFLNCEAQPEPTAFSEDALKDTFINPKGESVSLESILETYKGKTILIDVWASWCRDCIVGLPNLKALQKEYDEVAYVFLSMDKTQKSWKNGIEKYGIVGEHYFMTSGWNSAFSKFVDLDWVPRYMVVDKEGNIKLFRAIKANDPKIKEHLK
ncbi:MAG: TlpA disulfide reductase family protein [Psychroserpens sp.]|uniref:TlpA family protein disulfide reductase n=1 Tax=Psychroserpens sp. TaxID=2020870 RepID=UPI00300399BD